MWTRDVYNMFSYQPEWNLVPNGGGDWSEFELEMKLLKEAIAKADTIIELGAGWGRWCLTANAFKPGILCIGVEAEPTHYRWLCEALTYNHTNNICINKAIHSRRKWVVFTTGEVSRWYGQTAIDSIWHYCRQVPPWRYRIVKTVSLGELAALTKGSVYINSDIQGSERYAFDEVPANVQQMHIATHSAATHMYLRKRLSSDFRVTIDYPPGYKDMKLELNDGILELERK